MKYREEVKRTGASKLTDEQLLANGALGLCGESGEVCDLIKKYLFQGAPLNRLKIIEELGDVRWYFELLCIQLETSIEEIELVNIAKLRKRYPEGFDAKAAAARVDVVKTESK